MRLIEAAAQIDRVVRERGVEVESIEYVVGEGNRSSVVCHVYFPIGEPLIFTLDLSAPVTEETLHRDVLSAVLAPPPAVHEVSLARGFLSS